MIYVTHDQVEAMTMADKIVVLHAGVIEQVGSPLELYHRPQNTFVAGFIGSPKMNFIPATVAAAAGGALTLNMPGGAAITLPAQGAKASVGQKVTLGVRPEHVRVDGGGEGRLTGAVRLAEYLGSESMFYLSLADGTDMSVKADGLAKAKGGDSMILGLPADACHVFDASGKTLLNATLDK
jgi:multiple sugar transport system ATP-binding protein